MKNNFKLALLGCGRIAGHNSRAIISTPGLELVAVCDLHEEKAKNYADEFNVPYYLNYHKMLVRHPEIDAVVIATPSGMHFEHAIDMLHYQKSIIIEKPAFMKTEQLQKAYHKAENCGAKIFPVFQNRFNLAVQRVKRAICDGELGDINLVNVRVRWCRPQRYYDLSEWRGTYSLDGGALTNQGIHHVDLLRFFGGEVKKVYASMSTLGANIEVEDTVVATLEYEDARLGSLEVTTAARPRDFEASISILGSKGMAQIGGIAVNELQIFTPNEQDCKLHTEDFSECVYGKGHLMLYRSIFESLSENKPYLISQEDCFQTINLLHAFYCSDEQGKSINVSSRPQSSRLGRIDDKLSSLYRTKI